MIDAPCWIVDTLWDELPPHSAFDLSQGKLLANCVLFLLFISFRWCVSSIVTTKFLSLYISFRAQKLEVDSFSGYRIYPSKGKLFVRGDNKVRPLSTYPTFITYLPSFSRCSVLPARKIRLCSSNAKIPARSLGHKYTVVCTRKESLRRSLRRDHERP